MSFFTKISCQIRIVSQEVFAMILVNLQYTQSIITKFFRYSDFQVSEINEQGEVAKLTDLTPPDPPTEEAVVEDEDLLLCKYNVEILPMDTWDQINKIAVCSQPSEEKVEACIHRIFFIRLLSN